VRQPLQARLGRFEVEEIRPDGLNAQIRAARARGESEFIAAGGDGTVNLLLNAILETDPLDGTEVALGAIGLGSSNDFHKPFRSDSFVAGVPARVDSSRARARDVIRIDYGDPDGRPRRRFALINASLGITAEANFRFNAPGRLIRTARKLSIDAAIVAAVLQTLVSWRDVVCRLRIDGREEGTFAVTNLGLIKNPHFAGSFCYDHEPADGALGIHLCARLSPIEAVGMLAALHRRRFRGRPKTRSWVGKGVLVEADRPFALEADGEVVRARRAEIRVLPRRIRCCA
jgi:diacylglycerol kinase (ATP)